MRYLGNKTRISKYLIPILSKHLNGSNYYIEPFAGALGVISNLKYSKRVAFDGDRYIIALMKAVRDGWNAPTEITEEQYKHIKYNTDKYEDHLVGFVGYGCSFGGKWFAGKSRGGKNVSGKNRNHVAESARNLEKMRPKLQGIAFGCRDYHDPSYNKSHGNIFYCDPPYKGCTKFKTDFDSSSFWGWVRERSANNFVYVSEYHSPKDFKIVWEREHKTGIDHSMKTHKKSIERLFVYEGH